MLFIQTFTKLEDLGSIISGRSW